MTGRQPHDLVFGQYEYAPRAVDVLPTDMAQTRSMVAARFADGRVRELITRPPVIVLGREGQPGREVLHAGPPCHVGADLGDEPQGGIRPDGIDLCEIRAGEAVEGTANLEARFVLGPLPRPAPVQARARKTRARTPDPAAGIRSPHRSGRSDADSYRRDRGFAAGQTHVLACSSRSVRRQSRPQTLRSNPAPRSTPTAGTATTACKRTAIAIASRGCTATPNWPSPRCRGSTESSRCSSSGCWARIKGRSRKPLWTIPWTSSPSDSTAAGPDTAGSCSFRLVQQAVIAEPVPYRHIVKPSRRPARPGAMSGWRCLSPNGVFVFR